MVPEGKRGEIGGEEGTGRKAKNERAFIKITNIDLSMFLPPGLGTGAGTGAALDC